MEQMGASLEEVGAKVGGMGTVAVSQTVRRFLPLIKEDKSVAGMVKKLECEM